MATYYSMLPQNGKDCQQVLASASSIREMQQICENAECSPEVANQKLNELQVNCYHFQMMIYLATDQLAFAKYLHKRVPKAVKELATWKKIWEVGVAQWRSDHNAVYHKVAAGKWSDLERPFMEKLEANYRRKQAELVSKSYTSITIEELMGHYLGFTKLEQLNDFMEEHNLMDTWKVDEGEKRVHISKRQQNYEELLDAQALLEQFTKYVCFMEAENTVGGDDAPSSGK